MGRNKARVFASVLGLTAGDSDTLRAAQLAAAEQCEAALGEQDPYGQRYILDFAMAGPAGQGIVRSCWIVRTGEDFARLTTCYVL